MTEQTEPPWARPVPMPDRPIHVSPNVVDHRRRTAATHAGAAGGGAVAGAIAACVAVHPGPVTDRDLDLYELTSVTLDRVQGFWQGQMPDGWRDARVVLTAELGETTPCGRADAASGPFYCPADRKVYLDLTFLRAIQGDLARAYVIGHEVGHHVQELQRAAVTDVEIELEADCLAGRWIASELAAGRVKDQDVELALAEAAAVGDDRICPSCSPESWTHGSSAQRVAAVKRGMEELKCR